MEGALHCQADGVRYGDPDLALEFKQLGGNFELDSANRGLLGGLLPTLVHIQASDPAAGRLKRMIDSIVEEWLADRPGREVVVDRLIEVLLVEALRFRPEGVDVIEAAAFRILDKALDAGINFFDTAENYPIPPDDTFATGNPAPGIRGGP
jgi:hypothetical protein